MLDRRGLLRLGGVWLAAGTLAAWEADRAGALPGRDPGLGAEEGLGADPALDVLEHDHAGDPGWVPDDLEPEGVAPEVDGALVVRPMVFPVEGGAAYADGFGACRAGCRRRHLGQDLRAPKHRWVLAAFAGTVTRMVAANGNAGATLHLREGPWLVKYFHLNNDTPGTDNGRGGFARAFAPGLRVGQRVAAGQRVARLGDSGNAERTRPHLHFELWRNGRVYDPRPSLVRAARDRSML